MERLLQLAFFSSLLPATGLQQDPCWKFNPKVLSTGLEDSLALQEDINQLLEDLSDQRVEVREQATEALFRRGPSIRPILRQALKEAENGEARARIEEILNRFDRAERMEELKKYCKPVGDKAPWIEGKGIQLASEAGLGAAAFPAVFEQAEPEFLIAYWEEDFSHFETEIVYLTLDEAGFRPRQISRNQSFGSNYTTHIQKESFQGTQKGTIDEFLRKGYLLDSTRPYMLGGSGVMSLANGVG